VRFPVFAKQLSDVPAKFQGTDFIQKPLDLFAVVALGSLQLPLGKALEEAAAGLPRALRVSVDALEERVGNGDHHLGHGASIDGIAEARVGMEGG
jgi:hypothetical protein